MSEKVVKRADWGIKKAKREEIFMLKAYQIDELTNGAYGLTKENAPLSHYTTFHIGGPCDLLVEPTGEKELLRTYRYLRSEEIPYYIIGRGSNLLIRDGGIPGVVILLNRLYSDVTIEGSKITAQTGAGLRDVALLSFEAGLTGMEEISGIPGSVGGGVYMNAGAYGGEMKDVVESIHAVTKDGQLITLTIDEMEMGHRTSRMMTEGMLVTEVVFQLKEGNPQKIRAAYEDFTHRRTTKQPLDDYSAGSVFKRPKGGYASALIDQAGLRGLSVGDAQVSEKHCGFMINRGHAKASDVLALIEKVQKEVKDQFGIDLEPEVRIIGVDKRDD